MNLLLRSDRSYPPFPRSSRFLGRSWPAWVAGAAALLLSSLLAAHSAETNAVSAGVAGPSHVQHRTETGRITFAAEFGGGETAARADLYSAIFLHAIRATEGRLRHTVHAEIQAIAGSLSELNFNLRGEGHIRAVEGVGLADWGVRQRPDGARQLVLRLHRSEPPRTNFTATLRAETEIPFDAPPLQALTVSIDPASLANGYVRIDSDRLLDLRVVQPTGLMPMELSALPPRLNQPSSTQTDPAVALPPPQAFRFFGSPYTLPVTLTWADPDTGRVTLSDFTLAGSLGEGGATFDLHAIAHVRHPKGGSLPLLSANVALTHWNRSDQLRLHLDNGRYLAQFDQTGSYPLHLRFVVPVRFLAGQYSLDFWVAPSPLQPVVLAGLKPDAQIQLAGGAKPEQAGPRFNSFLPPNGRVQLTWHERRKESEAALVYSVEEASHIAVGPGLMRQTTRFDVRVMQGELSALKLNLRGDGEVTRVLGTNVLSWRLEPAGANTPRVLVVALNQPQKDSFDLHLQLQAPLDTLPVQTTAARWFPEGATRFGGYVRIVNEGAVRLEVPPVAGLVQISPEQFPAVESLKPLLATAAGQTFAFRFSGDVPALRIQADPIQPEVGVSSVLIYHLGETERTVAADLELDIREAPLRELVLRFPHGYALAHLEAAGLTDSFLNEAAEPTHATLRLIFGTPALGRQLVRLRLEQNGPLAQVSWALPKIEIAQAKSWRGHLGLSADPGLRLTPDSVQGLTEWAPALFPKKSPGLQAAFRLVDASWQGAVRVERLPQAITADALHLFSVGEGTANGSSMITYAISGAPVGTFRLGVAADLLNVEFTGKDIRHWQKIDGGYQVQLHTPVSGPYTLLATYERPFKVQGEALTFHGVQALDASLEQGHTLVISTDQFKIQPFNVSPGLVPLEPGEVPAEHRLLFDAPILAAYRYSARPFNLQLQLEPLSQNNTISQVVDFASLNTRISKEGQVVTEGRYFLKNRGEPHLRLRLPEGAQLWSASINGTNVVPVTADSAHLIPLPQTLDPDTVQELRLTLATRARHPRQIHLETASFAAPILFSEWTLTPEAGQRLSFRRGNLAPMPHHQDISGFAGLQHVWASYPTSHTWGRLTSSLISLLLAFFVLRSTTQSALTRWRGRHLIGGLFGLSGGMLASLGLLQVAQLLGAAQPALTRQLRFVSPIQTDGAAWNMDVLNLPGELSFASWLWALFPLGLAALAAAWAWLIAPPEGRWKAVGLAWFLVFWAALRAPGGAPVVMILGVAFLWLQLLGPMVRRWWQTPSAPASGTLPPAPSLAAGSALLLGAAFLSFAAPVRAQTPAPAAPKPVWADSIEQSIRVVENYAFGRATLRWEAKAGQILPALRDPAVLTRWSGSTQAVRWVRLTGGSAPGAALRAETNGRIELTLEYQLPVSEKEGEHGVILPVHRGLVHTLEVTLAQLDADLQVPRAAAIQRNPASSSQDSLFNVTLTPADDTWIGWKPRSRDPRREKPVYYVEWTHLLVPAAGIVEGTHLAHVRPAQGELTELSVATPTGMIIVDVTGPGVAFWRYDPTAQLLRVGLNPGQAKPFTLFVHSQTPHPASPFQASVGLLRLLGTSGHVGLVGIATTHELQLDEAQGDGFSPINLDDFPKAIMQPLLAATPTLALRRAFRAAPPQATLTLHTSAVEPDVRVESQQTLSLGEDRSLLAATLQVSITRAGIFRLSFPLPAGFAVETITSPALSHWTEAAAAGERLVTLHWKSRTEGTHALAIQLAGPGVRSTNGWTVPRLALRESTKQRGDLLIVPEQGLRLQPASRKGVTQLDPQQAGVRQKGVLSFRLLQYDWNLQLDLEVIDAWTQVSSLQHVHLGEALVRVTGHLQYEMENAGIKVLRVRLPAAAEGVQFRGSEVADFVARPPSTNTLVRDWEIKLARRATGKLLLQVSYSQPLADRAAQAVIQGIEALDVQMQRGFLTVQSSSRLETHFDAPPSALQPTDTTAIPRSLILDLTVADAHHVFRVVEPAYQLPLRLERHAAAKLLPARVLQVTLTSVVADSGTMLTQTKLSLVPGDKPLLRVRLPENAQFWFAFVGQQSVRPWREQNEILIPLDAHAPSSKPVEVEFLYSGSAGRAQLHALDLAWQGPRLDLPLEQITWRVFLHDKWKVQHWSGSLEREQSTVVPLMPLPALEDYLSRHTGGLQQKSREAEVFLSTANSLLEKGDPEEARRAFQNAYGLSQHNQAFNEDARVQLHNLRTQQALVGLNVRQAKVAGAQSPQSATPSLLRGGTSPRYTQQEAKQWIERHSAEDTAVQMRLVERLIQQQEAVSTRPASLHTTVPEFGQMLTFTRSLQVDLGADLNLRIQAKHPNRVGWRSKLGTTSTLVLALFGLLWLARWVGQANATGTTNSQTVTASGPPAAML